MIERNQISRIGIGTWGIGGFDKRDPGNNDQRQVEALTYMFNKGLNFVEITQWYAQGWTARLVSEALAKSNKKREDIFISQAIYPYDVADLNQAEKEVEEFTGIFKTDHVDTLQFTMGGLQKYGFEETVKFWQRMLEKGKTRFVSVTNVDLETLRKVHAIFGDRLFSDELAYGFEVRENEEMGLTGYGDQHGILNVILQSLRRNRTAKRNWPLLAELSKKYKMTQNQILINWMVSRGFLPLIKSETIAHIDENLAALGFEMDKMDIKRLNDFRAPGYVAPKIDWHRTGEGIAVHMLPNVFDEEYEKQNPGIVTQAEKFARQEYLKNDDFHQYHHIEGVMKRGLEIASQLKDVDYEALKLAIIFHDIDYRTYETHVDASVKVAESWLRKRAYQPERIKKVCEIMLDHSSPHRKIRGDAKLIEGKIIYDAEKSLFITDANNYEKYFPRLYLEETKRLITKY